MLLLASDFNVISFIIFWSALLWLWCCAIKIVYYYYYYFPGFLVCLFVSPEDELHSHTQIYTGENAEKQCLTRKSPFHSKFNTNPNPELIDHWL